MMKLTAKLAFHIFAFALDAFGVYHDLFVIEIGHAGFGGKLKYLTVWSIILQTVYFGVAIIADLSEGNQKLRNANQRNALQKFTDLFHATVAFPLAVFVAVTFWGIYAVDRELIYPKRLDAIIPMWLNHVLHTTILPLIVFDKVVSHHFYPKRLQGVIGTSALSLLYLFWILLIAHLDNFWVYPILEHMQMYQRAIFISICLCFFAAFYILGESVNNYLWGSQERVTPKRKPKRRS